MAYLSCECLSVGYGNTPVAEGISFSVDYGDAVFIVGENGAGKSTLVKTLLGLLPPLSGDMSFCDGASAGKIGYLPQKAESQRDFPASAWEVTLSGRAARLGNRPFYSKVDREAAEEALRKVGAIALKDKPFGSLSGGQQQRVLLARALAGAPSLLVLDEPTTGLDPEASESLYRTIDDLRSQGVGVIAVTHDVAAAMPHATHVLEMSGGTARFLAVESPRGGDA
ncbi:MAG: metal ABC transporter ATP-binding protein [bacterium]|nr:metal ABC transporter ATP-binding protein [bacterium]